MSTKEMKPLLESLGIPHKEIECYGRQIMVTAWSKGAADKWAQTLARFAKVRGVTESVDENVENRNTTMRPTKHKIYLVGATI